MALRHSRFFLKSPTSGQTLTGTPTADDLQWSEALGTVIDAEVFQPRSVFLRFDVATAAITAFRVLGKVHRDDDKWIILAATAADYAGGSKYVLEAGTYNSSDVLQDTDITTTGAAEYARLLLALPALEKLKFEATGADGTTVVTAYITGQSEDVHLNDTTDAVLGDVGLVDSSNTVIDPSAAYEENTVAGVGGYVTPMGAIRRDTRAMAPANLDYTELQTASTGDLRVRDDDANTDLDTLVTALALVLATQSPTAQIACAETGASEITNWDANGDNGLDITNSSAVTPYFVHVWADEDVFLATDSAVTEYAGDDGAAYAGGQTHIIPCRGKTHLHYKSVSASMTVYATIFGV